MHYDASVAKLVDFLVVIEQFEAVILHISETMHAHFESKNRKMVDRNIVRVKVKETKGLLAEPLGLSLGALVLVMMMMGHTWQLAVGWMKT